MAGPAPSWNIKDEPQGSYSELVAPAGLYKFTLADGAIAKLSWLNLTRSVQVRADGAVDIGLDAAGVAGANAFPVSDTMPFAEVFQTGALFFRNSSGGARVVSVFAVLSRSDLTGTSLALTAANGFDGVTTSVALDNPAP